MTPIMTVTTPEHPHENGDEEQVETLIDRGEAVSAGSNLGTCVMSVSRSARSENLNESSVETARSASEIASCDRFLPQEWSDVAGAPRTSSRKGLP